LFSKKFITFSPVFAGISPVGHMISTGPFTSRIEPVYHFPTGSSPDLDINE